MRIALVQFAFVPGRRAANLHALLDTVDRVANAVPAPDLIALPGGVDSAGVSLRRTMTQAMLQSIREALAWKTREWGVFLAAGLHRKIDGAVVPSAVLFDPDGDVVIRSPEPPVVATGAEVGHPNGCPRHITPVGAIGVVASSEDGIAQLATAGDCTGTLLIVPAMNPPRRSGRNATRLVDRLTADPLAAPGAHVAVVSPAVGDAAVAADTSAGTFLRAPDGRITASLDPGATAVLEADVDLAGRAFPSEVST